MVLAQKDVVINTVFNYLTESPMQRGFAQFVSHLVMFSEKVKTIRVKIIETVSVPIWLEIIIYFCENVTFQENITCSSYKIM